MALQTQGENDPGKPAEEAGDDATGAQDEFEAAFNDFAAKEDQPSERTGDQPAQAAESETRIEGDATASPTEATGKQPSAEKLTAAPVSFDWTKTTPEAKAAHEAALAEQATKNTQLEQQNVRLRGQVSGLMRKSSRAAPGADGQPSATEGAGTSATRKIDTAQLKKVAEDFPEVAHVVDAVEALRDETARLRAHSESLDAQEREQFLEGNYRELLKRHSDYDSLVKTADGKANPEFVSWVRAQPEFYQEIVKRNADDLHDVSAADRVMTDYKAHRAASSSSQPKGESPPNNQAARRERQVQGSIATPSRGGAAGSGPSDDFDAAFDHYASKHTQRKGASRR